MLRMPRLLFLTALLTIEPFEWAAAHQLRPATSVVPTVQQVGYDNEIAPLPSPSPASALPAPTIIPPADGSIYPSPDGTGGEVIISPSSDAWCMPPQEPGRTSSWTAAIELIPSRPRVTDGEFGRWDDEGAVALRIILGYEDPQGIGIRARVWGLGEEAEAQADNVDLSMGTFQLDLYKRLFLDRGEIVLGAGPASAGLEFDPESDGHSRFEGAGGDVFLDGYYGLIYFDRSELGAVVRARHSILLGDWHDTTGGTLIPRTDNDTMSITELAWGLEYRRSFGACLDHSWYAGILAEYQRWQSDWMSNLSGTSVGVSGLNIYTGINW